MSDALSVRELLGHFANHDIEVSQLAGQDGLDRELTTADIHRPGLALVGHFFHHHPEHMQVFGETEISFLEQRTREQCATVLRTYAEQGVPCFVITKNLAPPGPMLELADEYAIPLLRTTQSTGDFIRSTTRLLTSLMAPRTNLHGVMVDVFGVGVALIGPSGIGKSEAALELVLRGHRLVADDMVDVRLQPPRTLICRSLELTKHHMEIRGLGVINVQDLFGVAAVRDQKRLELVMQLQPWDPEDAYDRTGLEGTKFKELLGVEIEHLTIPVRAGRNLSEVIEVGARNRLLKVRGVDSASRFQEKLLDEIARASPDEKTSRGEPLSDDTE